MKNNFHPPRYNHLIQTMRARMRRRLRLEPRNCLRLISFLILLPALLFASNLGDAARQLADRIAIATGPGSIALDLTNRSSLDEKSVGEVRSALQAELRAQGVHIVAADQAVGTVTVVLSESLREYVWIAEIAIGSDQPRVAFASLPRNGGASQSVALPITLKTTTLFSQEERILDAALIDSAGTAGTIGSAGVSASARLLVLDATRVAVYRQQSGRWELDASLSINVSRPLPRDLRGRLLLRRDHLFDAYLPGTFCRSSASVPLTLTCSPSDDPWPLTAGPQAFTQFTPDETGPGAVRAFFATTRNFFTGALSPGIGKISTVPSFYSAAALPRSGYMLWAVAAVDGSVHIIDGITDQTIRGAHWGSDLAAVRSSCGVGTQLLVSGATDLSRASDRDAAHDAYRDNLRAFEIPDREPIAVSAPLEFDGSITALWSDASLPSAVAIVKRNDTGWYEANRIVVTCVN
ncbi:MAG: hypothetical protein WA609_00070 [Terriglobales bacterium]